MVEYLSHYWYIFNPFTFRNLKIAFNIMFRYFDVSFASHLITSLFFASVVHYINNLDTLPLILDQITYRLMMYHYFYLQTESSNQWLADFQVLRIETYHLDRCASVQNFENTA